MISKYPIKKLVQLNFWLAFNFFLLIFVSILASDGITEIYRAILISARGAIVLIVNIVINLMLLKVIALFKLKNNLKSRVIFLACSYNINLAFYLLIAYINGILFNGNLNIYIFLSTVFFSVIINTLILMLQNYIIIQEEKAKIELENSKLKAANSDASNQLLRQQIHPHFLFNSLNTLKSLYKIDACYGEKYLIHLSDFLRAAVSKNDTKVIPLKDELKLCVDYVEMQEIRFNDALVFSSSISDDALNNGYVPSFSIQPLVENAIKHNELTDESPLNIQIKQSANRIEVINNLKPKSTHEISTGSGLINLAERYRLIANDDIIIDQTEETFSVSIKILDNEDCYN